MLTLLLLKKIKDLPDLWVICLTILCLPISVGTAFKLFDTDNFSYRSGDTEINLGEVIKAVEAAGENDQLLEEQNRQIQRLTSTVQNAQNATRKRNINLPELYYIQEAAEATRSVNEELNSSAQELQEFVEEVYE